MHKIAGDGRNYGAIRYHPRFEFSGGGFQMSLFHLCTTYKGGQEDGKPHEVKMMMADDKNDGHTNSSRQSKGG
jgi:hypothetical protein